MKVFQCIAIGAAPFVCCSGKLVADVVNWDDGATGSGSWHAKDNWDTDEVPGTGDDVILNTGTSTGSAILLSVNTADIRSITAHATLQISETLIVSQPSEFFANSIWPVSDGTIRANGLVTLNGNQVLSGLVLEGTVGFLNNGVALIGSSGSAVRAPFDNQGTVVVGGTPSTGVLLQSFSNANMLSLQGVISSSSSVTNAGTFKVDGPEPSYYEGTFVQTAGNVQVTAGSSLRMRGGDQRYSGGTLQCDGELLLQHSGGPLIGHRFNGLTQITGVGQVRQLVAISVESALTINLTGMGQFEATDLNIANGVTLTNQGRAIIGNAQWSGDGTFANAGTVSTITNPRLDVAVSNSGEWTTGSFRMASKDFLNVGTLSLAGNNQNIVFSGATTGKLVNSVGGKIQRSGTITTDAFTISVSFEQLAAAKTTVSDGTLTLNGSSVWRGQTDSSSSGRLNLYGNQHAVASGSKWSVEGSGETYLGESGHLTNLQLGSNSTMEVKLGTSGKFYQESGNVILESGAELINSEADGALLPVYVWRRGDIRADSAVPSDRKFTNNANLEIINGGTKRLGVELINHKTVSMSSSLTVSDITYSDTAGRIVNQKSWLMYGGGGITGRTQSQPAVGEETFENRGDFLCPLLPGELVQIKVDFINRGLVAVEGGTLQLTQPLNQQPNGALHGGGWLVDPTGLLALPLAPTALREGAIWVGSGANSITEVGHPSDTKVSALKIIDTQTRTNSLTVHEKGALDVSAPLEFTSGSKLMVEGGELNGRDKIKGHVEVEDEGVVAPGNSPGTLTVEGDLTFTDGVYEWEAAGPAAVEHDHLIVDGTGNTATLTQVVLRPILLDGYVPAPGTTFTILEAINGATISGTFAFIDLGSSGGGLTYTPSYTANTVTITVGSTTYSTYADWKAAHFTTAEQADPLISAPEADPDDDGLTNLEERAFGLSPKRANASPVNVSAVTPGDATTPATMDLTFPWSDGMTDTSFSALSGTTLPGLIPTTHSVISSPSSNGISLMTIRVSFPAPATQTAFGAVKVTGP